MRADKAFASFIKRLFGADLRDPGHYDLVLRMDGLTPMAAAQIILNAVAHASRVRGLKAI